MQVRDVLPAGVLSVAGVALLAGLMLAPPAGAPVVGVVFPPWMDGGTALAHAAALALPIVDIRWRGHLVVVAPPADAAPLWRAGLPPGSLVIAASAVFCARPGRATPEPGYDR